MFGRHRQPQPPLGVLGKGMGCVSRTKLRCDKQNCLKTLKLCHNFSRSCQTGVPCHQETLLLYSHRILAQLVRSLPEPMFFGHVQH